MEGGEGEQVLGWEARRDKGEGRGIRSRLRIGENPGEGTSGGRLRTGRRQGRAEGSVGRSDRLNGQTKGGGGGWGADR